jgi:cytochrome c heme-lyase
MGNTMSSSLPDPSPSAPAAVDSAACPVLSTSSPQQEQSRCPVPESARSRGIYNVYGQRIDVPQAEGPADPLAALRATDVLDPKNNMPLAANQQPCPGQRKLLSTDRIESNIPKGGTRETWVYPSPQMFFNGERMLRVVAVDVVGAGLVLHAVSPSPSHPHPDPHPRTQP